MPTRRATWPSAISRNAARKSDAAAARNWPMAKSAAAQEFTPSAKNVNILGVMPVAARPVTTCFRSHPAPSPINAVTGRLRCFEVLDIERNHTTKREWRGGGDWATGSSRSKLRPQTAVASHRTPQASRPESQQVVGESAGIVHHRRYRESDRTETSGIPIRFQAKDGGPHVRHEAFGKAQDDRSQRAGGMEWLRRVRQGGHGRGRGAGEV